MSRDIKRTRDALGCCCEVDLEKPSEQYQSASTSYYTPGIRGFSWGAVGTNNLYRELNGSGTIKLKTDDSAISGSFTGAATESHSPGYHTYTAQNQDSGTAIGEISGAVSAHSIKHTDAVYEDVALIPIPAVVVPTYAGFVLNMDADLAGTCTKAGDPDTLTYDYDVSVALTITWSQDVAGAVYAGLYDGFTYPRYTANFSSATASLPNGMNVTVDSSWVSYERVAGNYFGNDQSNTFDSLTETSKTWTKDFTGEEADVIQTLSDLINVEDFLDDVEAAYDGSALNYSSSYSKATLAHSGISYISTAKSDAHRASIRGVRYRLAVPTDHSGSKCYAKYEIFFTPDDQALEEEILSESETSWTGPIDENDSDSRYADWIYLPIKKGGSVGLRFTHYKYYASSKWISY